MDKQDVLKQLPLIYFERKSANHLTYVKSFSGNKWLPDKGYAVKVNTKTIGKINNADGNGLILFTEDFLNAHPVFKDYGVKRTVTMDETTGKRTWHLEVVSSSEHLQELPPVDSREVINCISVGQNLIFNRLLARDPLLTALKGCFPDKWDKLLALAYYCINGRSFKSNYFAKYASSHALPCQSLLSAADITRLFQKISQSDVYNFLSEYNEQLFKAKTLSSQRFWALDSTSVSTYAKLRDAAYGHNKQEENIPQVNLMLITEQHSGRPVYYEYFNGSVPDMAAAASSFDKLVHLNLRSFIAVMDRGYYSSANIAALINQGYHFLLCAPIELVSTYDAIIAEAVQAFTTGQYFYPACQQNIFTKEQEFVFNVKGKEVKHKLFVHVCYNQIEAAYETVRIQEKRTKIAADLRLGLEEKVLREEPGFLKKYFIHNEDGSYAFNNAAFQHITNKAGLFVLVSDSVKDAELAYQGYKSRSIVEECFKNLKVRMACDRLYLSCEESLPGKLFVQFIALTLYMRLLYTLRKRREQHKSGYQGSVPELLQDADGIKEVIFADGYHSVCPISKTQRELLQVFGLQTPVSRYETGTVFANMIKYARKPHGEQAKTRF